MPNKNYISGRNKEYKIIKELKEKGFNIAQRSAGSHSPIDVFAIDIKKRKILFIQSKPDSMSKNKRKLIEEELKELNNNFYCEFKVV